MPQQVGKQVAQPELSAYFFGSFFFGCCAGGFVGGIGVGVRVTGSPLPDSVFGVGIQIPELLFFFIAKAPYAETA